MATSDKFLGTIIALYLNGKKVANAKSHSYDLSKDMVEVTNKDSAGAKEYLPGEYGAKIACEGFMEMDQTVANDMASVEDLHAYATAGTLLAARLTSQVVGDLYFEANGYISSLKIDAPNNDATTYSFDFQISGAITKGAES